MSKKLKLEITEVENGYVIQDMRDNRIYLAKNPYRLGEAVETIAIGGVAEKVVNPPMKAKG